MMPNDPPISVTVKSLDQLDAAIATADEVVIEGDEQLQTDALKRLFLARGAMVLTAVSARGAAEATIAAAADPSSFAVVKVATLAASLTRWSTNLSWLMPLVTWGIPVALLVGVFVGVLWSRNWFFLIDALKWPVVVVVVVVLLYRVAMHAMRSDHNVEISWKVTDYAAGKIVLKKVPVRVARNKS